MTTPGAAGLTRRAAIVGALAVTGVGAARLAPANVCASRVHVVATTSDIASLAAIIVACEQTNVSIAA